MVTLNEFPKFVDGLPNTADLIAKAKKLAWPTEGWLWAGDLLTLLGEELANRLHARAKSPEYMQIRRAFMQANPPH